MKLPVYDNRTPNTPLYSPKETPPFEGVKFVLLAVGLPVGLVACALLAVVGLLSAILR